MVAGIVVADGEDVPVVTSILIGISPPSSGVVPSKVQFTNQLNKYLEIIQMHVIK